MQCHHVYQSKWEAKVDSELITCQKIRAGAFVEDIYVMALKHRDVTVGFGHRFFTDLQVKVIRKQQFSKDLPQGGMELPALYVFKSTNLAMPLKLPGLVSEAMKT